MHRSMSDKRNANPASADPIPYVRGLQQLITQQRIDFLLARTRRTQKRRSRVLASSAVWLVIAMSLFASRSIPMVWRALHPSQPGPEPDESTFTKARRRLGVATLRLLFEEFARSLAPAGTPGVFHRSLRLMGIDGAVLDMPDTPDNERVFQRGGNQRSPNAFPQVRVMALCELGTHSVHDFAFRPIDHGEQAMVPTLARSLQPGMLLLGDRNFFGFDLIRTVLDRGCHLLARVKTSQLIFQRLQELPDGSCLSKIYASYYDRVQDRNGRVVRLIEYTHDDPTRPGCGERRRLLTDLLDPADLPALEAPLVCHQRWEHELVFDAPERPAGGAAEQDAARRGAGVVRADAGAPGGPAGDERRGGAAAGRSEPAVVHEVAAGAAEPAARGADLQRGGVVPSSDGGGGPSGAASAPQPLVSAGGPSQDEEVGQETPPPPQPPATVQTL